MKKDVNLKILERYGFKLYKRPKENVYLFKKGDSLIFVNLDLKLIEFRGDISLSFKAYKLLLDFVFNKYI
ncbi:hypothetical protein HMPREF3188_00684 [Tissierellia bacterium KA00581]|nr:hypothetical protein HMPREF3188_00684 [Tissierellia bacterium KA00581]